MPLYNPTDITAHTILATGVHGVGVSTVCSETEAPLLALAVQRATVALFQAHAATGDLTNVEKLNDGDTTAQLYATAAGKYGEVDFETLLGIKQYRQFGQSGQNGDGVWKIQYWDGDSWEDWETGILSRVAESWSGWTEPAAGVVITTKIRFICTLADTAGNTRLRELEIIY
jgi:hypothetical protein